MQALSQLSYTPIAFLSNHGRLPNWHRDCSVFELCCVTSKTHLKSLAEWTGLEPATPGVTGRYSNQLNYHSAVADNYADLAISQVLSKLGVP
ncbi:MAG: hypothetical protein RLZZ369_395 [Pseudomonadota bacterium]